MAKKKHKNKRKQKTKKSGGNKLKKTLRRDVLRVFDKRHQQPLNYKQIAAALDIRDVTSRALINTILHELTDAERLVQVSRGKYKLNKIWSHITGKVSMTASGAAYIITNDVKEDIYISQRNLNTALHGDTVEVYLFAKRRGRNPEGEVLNVLERAKTEFVGKIEISPDFAFLIPDSNKMVVDIFLPLNKLKGAKHGQKAIAKIVGWPEKAGNPFGEVVEVLGDAGEHSAEIASILAEHGVARGFPDDVVAEAHNVDTTISDAEVKNRKDFRDTLTFTIDPFDAKDFDDALSFKELPNGNYEVGIHIADVTHYVTPNSSIDKEAFERATSIYLVDRVIPMLPEVLSNLVCSLRPNEEKLTFSAVFELTPDAQVVSQWFGRTVIHSDRRFTYEEAQEVIETGQGDHSEAILKLNELAHILRKRRLEAGSIAFNKVEVRFKLDEQLNPAEVFIKESKDAHKLIEDFMLLANRKVAEFIAKQRKDGKPKTFVYRIHDLPNEEKIKEFDRFIRTFGYRLDQSHPRALAQSFNRLLTEIQGKPEENMIETLGIRTMSKAIYSTEANVGHYGLAFDHYTHFTSPIRRYPDVMVHRLLQHYLDGGASVDRDKIEDQCKHSSEMERNAAEAERDSIRYFQVRFLEDRVGEVFDGVVSGVSEWGVYVEIIENKCEGMIALKSISDDYYYFDEENYRIVGSNTGNVVQLGQEVKIRILKADLDNRRLDFELVEAWEANL